MCRVIEKGHKVKVSQLMCQVTEDGQKGQGQAG